VERDRVLAGVCSGVAEALAMDVTLVRLTFALLTFASGAGIVAYLGAWALLPAPGEAQPPKRRRIAGTVLLVWSVILALRGLGLSDSLVWPLALIGAGAALATGSATLGLDRKRARLTAIILTTAGILIFVGGNRHGSATTTLAPGAVAAALVLLLGPWAWRLGRERDAERTARIRTQERADPAEPRRRTPGRDPGPPPGARAAHLALSRPRARSRRHPGGRRRDGRRRDRGAARDSHRRRSHRRRAARRPHRRARARGA
jgi:phage shock protein PspC (stress-responsive transcriptional regulator)